MPCLPLRANRSSTWLLLGSTHTTCPLESFQHISESPVFSDASCGMNPVSNGRRLSKGGCSSFLPMLADYCFMKERFS
jgi:hypothetical protein